MAGSLLIDTSAVIAQLREDPAVEDRIRAADELFLPVTSLGELRYGADRSSDPEAKNHMIDGLLAHLSVLGTDEDTAAHYGRIKSELHRKGEPIPDNDMWIAACAFQHDLPLLAKDEHFERIDNLNLRSW
jgi:tRNA(fMet)-specific endonuclease VapC